MKQLTGWMVLGWDGMEAAVEGWGGVGSGPGVHECKCECVSMCVCVECKCRAEAVWCSQAAPDVPQQSTVQKLFISPSKAQLSSSA